MIVGYVLQISNIQYVCVGTFWVQKVRQEKLTKFTKVFELYQVFHVYFLEPNFSNIPNIYHSQKELTYFGRKVSTHVGLGVLAHFWPKESDKILKDFELYQACMYNFLYQIFVIFPLYILFTKRIDTFWSGDISTF